MKLKKNVDLNKTINHFQKKSEKLSESQKMIIAVIGTVVLVVLVTIVFSFLNSLVR